MSLRVPASIALSAVALLTAGCSADVSVNKKLNNDKAEELIEQKLSGGGITVDADCPERDLKAGDRFQCSIKAKDDSSAKLDVTQKDDKGNIRVEDAFFMTPTSIASIEHQIGRQIETQTSTSGVTVGCPDLLSNDAGTTFRCQARAGDQTRSVRVTRTAAGVRFEAE